MLGMHFRDLDKATFREILYLYDAYIGGMVRRMGYFSDYSGIDRLIEDIEETFDTTCDWAEFRWGSDYNGHWIHAKLYVNNHSRPSSRDRNVSFSFVANTDKESEKDKAMQTFFEREVDYFLFSRGLAVFIDAFGPRDRLAKLKSGIEEKGRDDDGKWIMAFANEVNTSLRHLSERFQRKEIANERVNIIHGSLYKLVQDVQNAHAPEQKISDSDKEKFVTGLAIINEVIGAHEEEPIAA